MKFFLWFNILFTIVLVIELSSRILREDSDEIEAVIWLRTEEILGIILRERGLRDTTSFCH